MALSVRPMHIIYEEVQMLLDREHLVTKSGIPALSARTNFVERTAQIQIRTQIICA